MPTIRDWTIGLFAAAVTMAALIVALWVIFSAELNDGDGGVGGGGGGGGGGGDGGGGDGDGGGNGDGGDGGDGEGGENGDGDGGGDDDPPDVPLMHGELNNDEVDALLAHQGKRSYDAIQMMDWVRDREWGIIVLDARNEKLGLESLEKVKSEVPPASKKCEDVRFHQLDIEDDKSVDQLKKDIVKEHGSLDILVNNAGYAYKNSATESFGVQAENTIAINYFVTKRVCDALFPILKPHSRVVNVSSQSGLFKIISDQEIKKKLLSPDLKVGEIDQILTDFIKFAKESTHSKHGFPNSAYGMSKVGTTALSLVQQRQLDKEGREDVIVNACCPGYVDTDMISHKGHLTPEQGAETPLYLASLPPNSKEPRGEFVYKKRTTDPVTGESR